jgi:hypothetical protein
VWNYGAVPHKYVHVVYVNKNIKEFKDSRNTKYTGSHGGEVLRWMPKSHATVIV